MYLVCLTVFGNYIYQKCHFRFFRKLWHEVKLYSVFSDTAITNTLKLRDGPLEDLSVGGGGGGRSTKKFPTPIITFLMVRP